MAKLADYPGVSSFTDNRGAIRWRFRKAGLKVVYLPGEPHTDAFDAAYQAAIEGRILVHSPNKANRALQIQALKERPVARDVERILFQTKMRAGQLGRDFNIDDEWVLAKLREQDFKCAITGIPFSMDRKHRNPHAISFDRIDNSRGYTPDNIRLVTMHVNLALNNFGLEQFDMLCLARVSKKLNEVQHG